MALDKRCEVLVRKDIWPYVIRCSREGVSFVRPPGGVEEDDLWCCSVHVGEAVSEGGTIVSGLRGHIREAMENFPNDPIGAIKCLRQLENIGLREARDLIMEARAKHGTLRSG